MVILKQDKKVSWLLVDQHWEEGHTTGVTRKVTSIIAKYFPMVRYVTMKY